VIHYRGDGEDAAKPLVQALLGLRGGLKEVATSMAIRVVAIAIDLMIEICDFMIVFFPSLLLCYPPIPSSYAAISTGNVAFGFRDQSCNFGYQLVAVCGLNQVSLSTRNASCFPVSLVCRS
jgi:hypothetical protein